MDPAQRAQSLPRVEKVERRIVMSTAHHVLIISVDGLHAADVADPALQQNLTNISALQQSGVTYARAATSKPSDSFPGTLAYLTGAGHMIP